MEDVEFLSIQYADRYAANEIDIEKFIYDIDD